MSLIRYLAFLTLSVFALGKPLNYKKVIYAVDCGSTQSSRSTAGFTYQADKGYSDNTKVADYTSNAEAAAATIRYTSEPNIYMTERHADDTFYYDIPVTTPGKYVLISKFSENWIRESRTRVFNIMFGTCMAEGGIDLYDKVGRFAAYDSYVEFEFKNNNIYVNGELCKDAYKVGNKLRVHYTKIGLDNPMIDAIVLFQGDLTETDYADQESNRREWDKKQKDEARRKEEERLRKEESRLKRRERNKRRNDEYEDFGEEFEDGDFKNVSSKSIVDYISDYLGLAFILLLGAGVIYGIAGRGSSMPISFENTDETERKEKKDKTTAAAAKKGKKN